MRRDALAPLPARPITPHHTTGDCRHLIGILKLAQAAGDTFHIRAMRLVLKSFDDRREARGVCGKGVAMRRPPDLRIVEGGVSFQGEPKPSRGRPAEPDNPECLWQAFVAALERSKRTRPDTPTAPS